MDATKAELRRFFLGLSRVNGLGAIGIKEMLEKCGDIQSLYRYVLSKKLSSRWQSEVDISLCVDHEAVLKMYDTKYVCLWENSYPYLLKQIPDPPAVLYYRGSLGLTSKDILVSIVGTRKISPQGGKHTQIWTSELAERGVVIVSGLALGTDTIVHREALNMGAYTIAVLAGPAHIPYPKQNTDIYEQIVSKGLVVSEIFPNTEITPGMFASRNRITAGLSQITVVMEAPIKSGSLITAESAFGYDRDVLAVPGTSSNYAGCNKLIKENKAILADSVDDIWDQIRLLHINEVS